MRYQHLNLNNHEKNIQIVSLRTEQIFGLKAHQFLFFLFILPSFILISFGCQSITIDSADREIAIDNIYYQNNSIYLNVTHQNTGSPENTTYYYNWYLVAHEPLQNMGTYYEKSITTRNDNLNRQLITNGYVHSPYGPSFSSVFSLSNLPVLDQNLISSLKQQNKLVYIYFQLAGGEDASIKSGYKKILISRS